jgi:photosystem II stability/assembly factor-like uncharacterized protein
MMTRSAAKAVDHRARRASAQARARQRDRNRRIVQIGALVALVALVGIGIWWLTRADDLAESAALYQFHTPDFHSLAFDLSDPDTVFFGSHDGMLISRDAGESWEEGTLRGQDAMQQSIALADPPRHYVAGHDVFMVSADGGATWQTQHTNLPSLDLHAFAGSPSDPNRLYTVPAGMGLWTSSDGGATWSETAMPSTPNAQPVALAVAPNDSERVYLAQGGQIAISDDAGMTWRSAPAFEGIIYTMAIAADAGETLYAGTNQGLWRGSADGTWERMAVETSAEILALAISPVQPLRVAVVDAIGNFYRSDDGGATWVRSS